MITIPYSTIISTPIGKLGIRVADQQLVKLDFLLDDPIALQAPTDSFTQKISDQLATYFLNASSQFKLAFKLQGTPFQQAVWAELQKIPRGQPATYKTIAERLKTSPRAVGNACRANPIPVIVPCHRVVAQNGLGGFAGDTTGGLIAIKKWLLQHELSV